MAVTVKDNFTGFKEQECSARLAAACLDYQTLIVMHLFVDIALFL